MSRIAQNCRPYERKGEDAHPRDGCIGEIKIGFNANSLKPEDERGRGKSPFKMNGFYIRRKDFDPTTKEFRIDEQAMQSISPGFSTEKLKALIRETINQRKQFMPEGILPREIHGRIADNAVRRDDGWHYPALYSEQFLKFDDDKGSCGVVPFCTGDGCKAKRLQLDGTFKVMECNPIGKNVPAEQLCKYSANKTCKLNMAFAGTLTQGPESEKPINQALGHSAKYVFTSTGRHNANTFIRVLDQAAAFLNGRLAGIRFSLSFSFIPRKFIGKTKSDPNPRAMQSNDCPQVIFSLNLKDIDDRRKEIMREQLIMNGAKTVELLEAPRTVAESQETESAPFVAVFEPEDSDDQDVENTAEQSLATDVEDEQGASHNRQDHECNEELNIPPPTPENAIYGIIEVVQRAEKDKSGKPLKSPRFGIKINGEWMSTFSETDAKRADECKRNGRMARATFEMNGKFKNLSSLEVL
jgi:hypothetical protein